MVNCEIAEVLKNIRLLKTQTNILMGINLKNTETKSVNLALEELSVTIFKYLKGDFNEKL